MRGLRWRLGVMRRDRIGVVGWWIVRMLLHHVHGMRRVRMVLGRRRMGCVKVGYMRGNDLVFPFTLQFGQNVLCHTIFVKFGLNGGNNVVDDGPVDYRHYLI
jgi:hypothetical protein